MKITALLPHNFINRNYRPLQQSIAGNFITPLKCDTVAFKSTSSEDETEFVEWYNAEDFDFEEALRELEEEKQDNIGRLEWLKQSKAELEAIVEKTYTHNAEIQLRDLYILFDKPKTGRDRCYMKELLAKQKYNNSTDGNEKRELEKHRQEMCRQRKQYDDGGNLLHAEAVWYAHRTKEYAEALDKCIAAKKELASKPKKDDCDKTKIAELDKQIEYNKHYYELRSLETQKTFVENDILLAEIVGEADEDLLLKHRDLSLEIKDKKSIINGKYHADTEKAEKEKRSLPERVKELSKYFINPYLCRFDMFIDVDNDFAYGTGLNRKSTDPQDEYDSDEKIQIAWKRLQMLADKGVKCIIDLDGKNEVEYAVVNHYNSLPKNKYQKIAYIPIAIPLEVDRPSEKLKDGINKFKEVILNDRFKPVYMHCSNAMIKSRFMANQYRKIKSNM